MGERTAAEVLAEKLGRAWEALPVTMQAQTRIDRLAACLAEDPAITVRTDMVVERFVVEFHHAPDWAAATSASVRNCLLSVGRFHDVPAHRIVVRPYPEGEQ